METTSEIQQLLSADSGGEDPGSDEPDEEISDSITSGQESIMWKKLCSASAGICGLLFIVLGIVVAILFDPFIKFIIDEELVIRNDNESQTYKLWVDPPVVPYLRIYFFNLTNAQEFLNSMEKPKFNEVGPYSYREKWKKVNIVFHENGTVTYENRKVYYFDRSQSSGPENDVIQTLNVPVNVAVDKMSKMGQLAQLALSSMLAVLNETALVQKTVNELVWGYSDPLMTMAKKFLPKEESLPFDEFGFFYNKNGSTDGRFSVFTGAVDIRNYTIIDTFNSSRELKYWRTAECNRINGTDGTSYPPHLTRNDTLYLFNENLCRSLPLTFNNSLFHDGIQAYRFTPPKDVFAHVSEKPENMCYCVGGPPCIGGGVFNISACQFNVSSVLSWPHFYQADQSYLDAVSGLHPDPLKHSLFMDVNPTLGMPLAAQARIQINFITRNMSTIKPVANIPNMVFPVIWFEDGVEKLSPEVISLLEKSTYVPKVMKISLLSLLFIFGVALTVVGMFAYAVIHSRTSSNLSITKESSAQNSASDYGHSNPAMSTESPD